MYDDFLNWKFLELWKFANLQNWNIGEIGLFSPLVNNEHLIIFEIIIFACFLNCNSFKFSKFEIFDPLDILRRSQFYQFSYLPFDIN